jgi:hypothetical protein
VLEEIQRVADFLTQLDCLQSLALNSTALDKWFLGLEANHWPWLQDLALNQHTSVGRITSLVVARREAGILIQWLSFDDHPEGPWLDLEKVRRYAENTKEVCAMRCIGG